MLLLRTQKNEDIIVVVKVIVIGQFLSFDNFHQWTGTYVPTSPCCLKLVRTSPTVLSNSKSHDQLQVPGRSVGAMVHRPQAEHNRQKVG